MQLKEYSLHPVLVAQVFLCLLNLVVLLEMQHICQSSEEHSPADRASLKDQAPLLIFCCCLSKYFILGDPSKKDPPHLTDPQQYPRPGFFFFQSFLFFFSILNQLKQFDA